jgi:hypothetical protein
MFEETSQRDPLSVRFTVKLPFRNNPPNLGHWRELAIKRFKSLENKFFRNSSLFSGKKKFNPDFINSNYLTTYSNTTNSLKENNNKDL